MVTNAKELNSHFYNNPGIVDIMPTIANYLNVSIPKPALMEVDGVSLTGILSADSLTATYSNDSIHLTWTALEKDGNVKIWLATTNHFKEGGKDNYTLIKEVPVSNESYSFNVKNQLSDFYKIVLEGKYNFLNRWVILK